MEIGTCKRIITLLLLVVLLFSAVACSSAPSVIGDSPFKPQTDDPKTLRFDRDGKFKIMFISDLHSDIDTLERAQIIRDMRLDVFDVLVGINLLREGLDIPEVALVAILDADKEGFLRSETSLVQTIGRAARNSEGRVIMYADAMTDSMDKAISETNRRREIQMKYNEEHGITPTTIKKAVRDLISVSKEIAAEEMKFEKDPESMDKKELEQLIKKVEKQMKKAAAELDFESAASLRDQMINLKKALSEL